MKNTQRIILLLLVLYLPAVHAEGDAPPEEPATPRTVRIRVTGITPLTGEDVYTPMTIMGDRVLVGDFSITWGDVFYGGPTLCLINVWGEGSEPLRICKLENMLSSNPSQNEEVVTHPAIGGVCGFNIGGHGFLSAHLELAVSFVMSSYFEIDLYPRVTAGPDFNLGGGWRLSAEVDYFFMYIGLGGSLSYTF